MICPTCKKPMLTERPHWHPPVTEETETPRYVVERHMSSQWTVLRGSKWFATFAPDAEAEARALVDRLNRGADR